MKLGVVGGTFDPIHNGHIAAGRAAQDALELDAMLLVPSHIPPHRLDPVRATSEQRFEMARLAAQDFRGWSASRLEIDRTGPSYTFDTLTALKQRGDVEWQLFFIIGADAFAEIASWSRYPAVLDLANFVVVSRPGITLDSLHDRVPSAFRDRQSASTRVILLEAHTPDISSTDIRRRVRSGDSLTGLVPDAVARYIAAHALYSGH